MEPWLLHLHHALRAHEPNSIHAAVSSIPLDYAVRSLDEVVPQPHKQHHKYEPKLARIHRKKCYFFEIKTQLKPNHKKEGPPTRDGSIFSPSNTVCYHVPHQRGYCVLRLV